jgi:hypothetical protein
MSRTTSMMRLSSVICKPALVEDAAQDHGIAHGDFAGIGLALFGEQVDERALADAVRANDADAVAGA